VISLKNKVVLEIGCGDGSRSAAIAKKVRTLEAIDPDIDAIILAKKTNQQPNITYRVAIAEKLPFQNHQFDVAIFTLSLHHVPPEKMRKTIH